MAAQPIGSTLVAMLATDKFFLERSGVFSDMFGSAIGIDHMTLSKSGSITTLKLWRSTDETVQFGPDIPLEDGADGTGLSLGNHSPGQTYTTNEAVLSINKSIVRSKTISNTGNTPPVTIDDTADWEIIHNSITHKIITAAETVRQGVDYFVDTSAAGFTMVVPAEVSYFTVVDFGSTWTSTKQLTIDVGLQDFVLDNADSGNTYRFIRSGTTIRAYGSDNTITVRSV